jgi:hypothetical protein
VQNSEKQKEGTVKTSSLPSVVPVGTKFAPNPGYGTGQTVVNYFTQHVDTAADITLTLKVTWTGAEHTRSVTLTKAEFPTNCTPPLDATATLTTTPPTCAAAETLVLGAVVNATWPNPAPTNYPVVATANTGHLFPPGTDVSQDGTTKTFTGTLKPKLDPDKPPCYEPVTVTPVVTTTQLTCAAGKGSYTLGALIVGSVSWTVNGVPTPAGTYPVDSARSITLVATPANPQDGLDPAWVNPKVITFAAPSGPACDPTLAKTGTASDGMLLLISMLLLGLGGSLVAARRMTLT